MENYIHQLLEDLEKQYNMEPTSPDYRLLYPRYSDLPDEIAYIAEWEMARPTPVEELFNIPAHRFPPAEKLNQEQMERIITGILDLWEAWRITTSIPAGVPIEITYKFLIQFWKEESITFVSEGHIHMDLCDYDIFNCPWSKEYCECLKGLPPEEIAKLNIE